MSYEVAADSVKIAVTPEVETISSLKIDGIDCTAKTVSVPSNVSIIIVAADGLTH